MHVNNIIRKRPELKGGGWDRSAAADLRQASPAKARLWEIGTTCRIGSNRFYAVDSRFRLPGRLLLRTKLDSCFGGNRFYAVDSRFRLPGRLLLHERRGLIFLFLSSVARG